MPGGVHAQTHKSQKDRETRPLFHLDTSLSLSPIPNCSVLCHHICILSLSLSLSLCHSVIWYVPEREEKRRYEPKGKENKQKESAQFCSGSNYRRQSWPLLSFTHSLTCSFIVHSLNFGMPSLIGFIYDPHTQLSSQCRERRRRCPCPCPCQCRCLLQSSSQS